MLAIHAEPPRLFAVYSLRCPIRDDFDRIALVSEDGAAHNDHYHNFLLQQLPSNCQNILEIGCGTGAFARCLAGIAKL